MSEKKRICLVIPSLSAGGMERIMAELSLFLSTIDFIDTYFLSYTKGEKFYELPQNINFLEPDFEFNKNNKILHSIKTFFFLRRKIKYIKPHAVLSFGETYNSFVLLSTLFLKTKIFISDRSKPDKKWGLIHDFLRKHLYKSAYGIVSQTNFSQDFLYKLTKHKKISVIPNPVRKILPGNVSSNNVILSVGRLISTKKFEILIELFFQINNHDWELWIAGDGPVRPQLESLVKTLHLQDRVKLLGTITDIDQLYSKAGIFAFTSISEGFPNALLEAQSAGLPCVAFDCIAGPADIIMDGWNGFLIPEMDLQEFKIRLDLLMNDSSLRKRFSENALEEVKKFDLKQIGEKYLKFLLS